jgi:menaquinone-9 beta-reductase
MHGSPNATGTTYHDADVAVVGASLAGCTTAILLARAGLRVALIEKHRSMQAYKALCTHFILPCATPTIRRLGLAELIESAGGLRNDVELYNPWGWIDPGDGGDDVYGYSIRREVLDPIIRRLAVETEGVTFLPGHRVRTLERDGRRVTGVTARAADGSEAVVGARLVVGADGKASAVASLAGARERVRPNNRCSVFAHYTGVRLVSGNRAQMWLLDPDVAYTFPNDAGITLLAIQVHKRHWEAVSRDPEAHMLSIMRSLPNAPDLEAAERVSKVMVIRDYPLVQRPAAPAPGLALVGDAALTSDPLWGVGCGWAFQSAEWLADAVRPALRSGGDLDSALRTYARRHRQGVAGHHRLIADTARARPMNPLERLMGSAAARDQRMGAHFRDFGQRRVGPATFLAPPALARAALVNVRFRVRAKARPPVSVAAEEPTRAETPVGS